MKRMKLARIDWQDSIHFLVALGLSATVAVILSLNNAYAML